MIQSHWHAAVSDTKTDDQCPNYGNVTNVDSAKKQTTPPNTFWTDGKNGWCELRDHCRVELEGG